MTQILVFSRNIIRNLVGSSIGQFLSLICLYLVVGCSDGPKSYYSKSFSVHREKDVTETVESTVAEASLSKNVEIHFRMLDAPGGRVRIEGDTNLPVGTHLMFLVTSKSGGGFRGQGKTNVKSDGIFFSADFGPSVGMMPDLYEATVTMPIASVQPDAVRSLIGNNGENLRGPLVKKGSIGVTVQKLEAFTIGGQKSVGFLEDFYYEIVDESVDLSPGSRALHVSITRKIAFSEIKQLAKVIKERHSEYSKTFIFFYLPGMTIDGDAYATSHFDPDVTVKMMSGSIPESREVLVPDNGKVVGIWREEGRWSNVTQIIERGGGLFIRKTKASGKYSENELMRQETSGQNRLYQKGESIDYILINQSGELEYWDDQGLIFTVLKVQ